MPLVVMDLGEQYLLSRLLRKESAFLGDFQLCLFKNDFNPKRDSIKSQFVEGNYAGYARRPMTALDWSVPINLSGVAQSIWGTGIQSWVSSSGTQLLYGVFVLDFDANVAIWAERFALPTNVTTGAGPLYVPMMRLRSENQPT